MKYTKPEIKVNAFAQFESVLTHACTKQTASKGCRYYDDPISPGKGAKDEYGDLLVGVTDWGNDLSY